MFETKCVGDQFLMLVTNHAMMTDWNVTNITVTACFCRTLSPCRNCDTSQGNWNCFKQKSIFDGCLILSSIIICFENYFRPPLQIDRLNPWWTVPDLGTGGQWFDFKWASNIFKHSNRLKSFNVNTLRKQTFHPTLFLIRNLFLSWPFCAYDFNVIKWRTSKPHFSLFPPFFNPLMNLSVLKKNGQPVISGYSQSYFRKSTICRK